MKLWSDLVTRLRWQRVPVGEIRIDNPQQETKVVLGYSVLYVAAAWMTGLLIRWKPLPIMGAGSFTSDAWYVFLFKILLLLLVPMLWFAARGYRFRDLLPGWSLTPRSAVSILVSFLVGMSVNLGRLHFIQESVGDFSTTETAIRLTLGALLPLVMAGLPEEFVFRGIMQTRLERSFGRIVSIGVTSLLFTAWHLPTRFLLAGGVEGTAGDFGSVILGTGIPVFIVSVIFCIFWDRYRSLLPLIAAHWGVDLIPHMVSMMGVRY